MSIIYFPKECPKKFKVVSIDLNRITREQQQIWISALNSKSPGCCIICAIQEMFDCPAKDERLERLCKRLISVISKSIEC